MTDNTLSRAVSTLDTVRLQGIRRGVEKESLRVQPAGGLSLTPHPVALGAALTHSRITTDYSESQLELITGVHGDAAGVVDELTQLHQFVYRHIGEELLWPGSMPCGLPADETIPIGRYGTSNIGRAKSVYRMGLGLRYGRRMQTISGIHYNWSLPGVDSDGYFALIRNFRRHSFLLLTLFGASPAVCPSFVEGRQHNLLALPGPDPSVVHTLHLPYATSLRMGNLGYQSDAQAALAVSYNCLESYAGSLDGALTRPFPPYERIGVRNLGGEYNQLATSLLQIENEFYGTIRPKRVIRSGERPLHALRDRGVEYVEVRCMDLDPFEPVGIQAQTMRFLDVFLLHCLLSDSPPDTPEEIAALARNQQRTATRGREPGLRLERAGREVTLQSWGEEILAQCAPLAEALDAAKGGEAHAEALEAARRQLADLTSLPSSRVLAAIQRDGQGSYTRFVRGCAEAIRRNMLDRPLAPAVEARMHAEAAASLAEQARIEAADSEPFEVFRQRYVDPIHLMPRREGQAL